MKKKHCLLLFSFFSFSFVFSQENLENYIKYNVKMPKTSIEFSAPKDSVIKYVKEIEGNNLTEISKNEFLLFDDKQAFITKESLKENTDKKTNH